MNSNKQSHRRSIRFRHRQAEHWQDMYELHEVLHSLPGYIKALILELLEKPMSREEIRESVSRLERRLGRHERRKFQRANPDNDIAFAIEQGVLVEKEGKFHLTPGGREIAEHLQEVIPFFFEVVLSPKTVAIVTIGVHVLLSILKLSFGCFSRSAGLIADGIDNSVDTVSSVLVWFGIKFNRERIVSLFIVVMMFISVGGVAIATSNRILHPGPVEQGVSAFIISALCGFLMLGLSAYQYTTGKRVSNFAIMCQSVDSRNHFLTSLLVCGGIFLSFIAENVQAIWANLFYYADAAASIIIGLLILKSAIELSAELIKPGDEPTHVSHFMGKAQEKLRLKLLFDWISEQLRETPQTKNKLEERFQNQFCEETPKILMLSGIGYRPQSSKDLHLYLDKLVKKKKLVLSEGKYCIVN